MEWPDLETVVVERSAAVVGEPQHDRWHPEGRFGLSSLLIDPAVVWREQVGPFTDGGDPSLDLLTTAARRGEVPARNDPPISILKELPPLDG